MKKNNDGQIILILLVGLVIGGFFFSTIRVDPEKISDLIVISEQATPSIYTNSVFM